MVTSDDSETHLNSLVQRLQVPADFSRYEKLVETEIIASLEQWKHQTEPCLVELRDLVAREGSRFSVLGQAQVISAAASFEGEGSWITQVSCDTSKREDIAKLSGNYFDNLSNTEILASFADPPVTLLETILTHYVKALFKSNPHPSLNLSTGRKLPEHAGGLMGSQDYYEGQVWKTHPGASNLVSWCARNIQVYHYFVA